MKFSGSDYKSPYYSDRSLDSDFEYVEGIESLLDESIEQNHKKATKKFALVEK